MTVDEFLSWNPGGDRRYELIDGNPVGQSAPSGPHGRIVNNLSVAITTRLRNAGRPCAPESGSVLRIDARHSVRAPDLLVRCGADEESADAPVLAVEVLSPDNSASEMARKREDYASVGIREVVELEQDEPRARIFRLDAGVWHIVTVAGLDAVLHLDSLTLDLPLAELYRAVPLAGEH